MRVERMQPASEPLTRPGPTATLPATPVPLASPYAAIRSLQRSAGNRTVTAVLQSGMTDGGSGTARIGSRSPTTTGVDHLLLARSPAVARAPEMVQRLTKLSDFQKGVVTDEAQAKDIGDIQDNLVAFHAIKAKADGDGQQRLAALRGLDSSIHAWFGAHVTTGVADTKNGAYLTKLLESSETEHRSLVTAIKRDPMRLPIDETDLGPEERKQLLVLWRSIVDRTGNLRIRERLFDGGFSDRMLAGVAKLLQTPAGRLLLQQINEVGGNKGMRVEVGPEFEKQLKTLGRKDPKDSQAVPKTQEGDVTSMAYSVHASPPEGAKVADYRGKADPGQFNEFVTSLPKGVTHFRYGGTVYRLGTGVGSYVKMAGKGKLHTNIGEHGQEIIVPEFITLGHELGHSLRMLKGSTVPFVEDVKKFGFAGSETEQKLWNNAEEFVNISGVENVLRGEHGMERRAFHAGDRATTQGPIIRAKIDGLLTKKGADAHKEVYEPVFKIYGGLLSAKDDNARLQILLAPETKNAVDALEKVVASDVSPMSNPAGKDGPSTATAPKKTAPKRRRKKPTKGKGPSTSSAAKPEKSQGGAKVGTGDRVGSVYDMLTQASGLYVDVPIDVGEGGSGGSTSVAVKERPVTSEVMSQAFLGREDYDSVKESLGTWLKDHDISVLPNNGHGRNNCLIISLLQHAKQTQDVKPKEVQAFKDELVTLGIRGDEALLPDGEAMKALVRSINLAYGRDLRPVFVTAFGSEDPPFLLVATSIGTEHVAIWDKLGHYEALV